jgi:hypothetical protein
VNLAAQHVLHSRSSDAGRRPIRTFQGLMDQLKTPAGPVVEISKKCVWCEGSGFIHETGLMCRTCHGRGVILAP